MGRDGRGIGLNISIVFFLPQWVRGQSFKVFSFQEAAKQFHRAFSLILPVYRCHLPS